MRHLCSGYHEAAEVRMDTTTTLTHAERDSLIALVGANPALCRLIEADGELLPFLLKDIPGSVGQRLRTQWYGRILGTLGDECRIGPGVTMLNPQHIHLAEGVGVDGGTHFDARGRGIRIGQHTQICFGSYLRNETTQGYIHIGAHSYLGSQGIIYGHAGVEIGDHVLIAPQVAIVPYQHHISDRTRLIAEQGGAMEKVVVDDDVYLGMSVRILLGVTIGRGAVVGAGAVVTRDIPPYAVAMGVPARVSRYR